VCEIARIAVYAKIAHPYNRVAVHDRRFRASHEASSTIALVDLDPFYRIFLFESPGYRVNGSILEHELGGTGIAIRPKIWDGTALLFLDIERRPTTFIRFADDLPPTISAIRGTLRHSAVR